jgi:hypothetical protein
MPVLLGEMVRNNQKTGFYAVFFLHCMAIWAPPNRPKKVAKGSQVGGRYGPTSKLNNKHLTKLLGPFFLGDMVRNNQKTGFYAVFCSCEGHLGTPK